jgi:hypothetical protein
MAVLTGYGVTGEDHVFVRRNADGLYLKDSATFTAYTPGDVDHYDIPATEDGDSGVYVAEDPADGVAGDYVLIQLAGADLTEADLADNIVWQETLSSSDSSAIAAAVWAYLAANANVNGSMGELVVGMTNDIVSSIANLLDSVGLSEESAEELTEMISNTLVARLEASAAAGGGACGCSNRARTPISSSGQVVSLKR